MATIDQEKTSKLVSGSDILIECFIDHGVDVVFAYPGGASMPIHQSLTHYRSKLRTILPRHEQGGIFAAEGYARSSGKTGVCVATSGPGAPNLSPGGAAAPPARPPVALCSPITGHPHYNRRRVPDTGIRKS